MASLNTLPRVAQPAIQEGRYVGRVIRARLAGTASGIGPFRYRNKGSIATIGPSTAWPTPSASASPAAPRT